MVKFWEPFNTGRIFIPFSLEHKIALIIILFFVITCFKFKEFYKKNDLVVRRYIAIAMFLQQILLYLWYLTSGSFSLKESLPLYTCRIAIIISIFMLINPKQWMVDMVYFWGFVGAFIALLSPDTSTFAFPHFMFLQYFLGHGLLIFVSIYMKKIKEYTIDIKSFIRVLKVTLFYTVSIMIINNFLGSNYAYLNGKPSTATVLDILPPYPYYIPIMITITLVLFFVSLIPFYIKKITSLGCIFVKKRV